MMPETELLYYTDPYLSEFEAAVISAEVSESGKDTWDIVLDRTCFYPEGGGQPSDLGFIGGRPVIHVYKKEGRIFHRTKGKPGQGRVKCSLDWEHRFDFMQQHTGQHILSGALHELGYSTVSVHQGECLTTIEVDKPEISPEDLEAAENKANGIINLNLPVKDSWVNDSAAEELELRRKPKVSGNIRIVSIGDFDHVACGGVHLGRTGETGLVKSISVEKIRDHARIAWKIGERAIRDYAEKTNITGHLVSMFSSPQHEILQRIEEEKQSFQSLQRANTELQNRYAGCIMGNLLDRAEKIGPVRFVSGIFSGESPDFLKTCISGFGQQEDLAVFLSNSTENGFQWVLFCGHPGFEFNDIRQQLLSLIDGKGGGRSPVWQGIGNDAGAIAEASDFLKGEIGNMFA